MNVGFDAAMGIAFINLVNTVVNLYWSMRLKWIQGNKELVTTLTDQSRAKDQVIHDLKTESRAYKMQYHNLLKDYQKLEGEVKAYRDLGKQLPQNAPVIAPSVTSA